MLFRSFDDEVDELPASSVQELPHIKDCAVQLATIAGGSLFPDKAPATCILQVAKADVTLPNPNNSNSVFFIFLVVSLITIKCKPFAFTLG